MGDDYVRDSMALLLRINLMRHDFVVKGQAGDAGGGASKSSRHGQARPRGGGGRGGQPGESARGGGWGWCVRKQVASSRCLTACCTAVHAWCMTPPPRSPISRGRSATRSTAARPHKRSLIPACELWRRTGGSRVGYIPAATRGPLAGPLHPASLRYTGRRRTFGGGSRSRGGAVGREPGHPRSRRCVYKRICFDFLRAALKYDIAFV